MLVPGDGDCKLCDNLAELVSAKATTAVHQNGPAPKEFVRMSWFNPAAYTRFFLAGQESRHEVSFEV